MAIARVSVFAFSLENVLDDGAAVDTIPTFAGILSEITGEGFGVVCAVRAGVGVGVGTGESAGGFGAPPILREIVGAGLGASICSGRSTGSGGGGGRGVGATNPLPGTNSYAPALSLLIFC